MAKLAPYHPNDKYLNDFTLIKKEDTYHLFHIEARHEKGVRPRRNERASEGHATSKDLMFWHEQPSLTNAFGASMVVEVGPGEYRLMSHVNHRQLRSHDLFHWEDVDVSRLTEEEFLAAGQEYGMDRFSEGRIGNPRDPFILYDEQTEQWLCLYCNRDARVRDFYCRGCVGAAVSKDFEHWEIKEPLFTPGKYWWCESPHLLFLDGKWVLIYSMSPEYGLRYAVSDTLYGPYEEVGDHFLLPAAAGASEHLQDKGKNYFFFRLMTHRDNRDDSYRDQGAISFPYEMRLEDGRLLKLGPYHGLNSLLEDDCLGSGMKAWDKSSMLIGDWTLVREDRRAPMAFAEWPAGTLYAGSLFSEAVIMFEPELDNFDFRCRLMNSTLTFIPYGEVAIYLRYNHEAGTGYKFSLSMEHQMAILENLKTHRILSVQPMVFQADKWYDVRIFFRDRFLDVYVNDHLTITTTANDFTRGRIAFASPAGTAAFYPQSLCPIRKLSLAERICEKTSLYSMDDFS